MKISTLLIVAALNLFLSIRSFAQKDLDVIRRLENMERQAILKSDTLQLSNLMSKKIIVQNPETQ